jgi:hypothetical protein
MILSQAQRDAMLALGSTASEQDFVTKEVLDELLSMHLVYWRDPDDVEFTTTGEEIYRGLAAHPR